jgi:hypothetical protein
LGLVGPHSGGVDDLLGRDVEFLACLQVRDASTGDPVTLALKRGDTRSWPVRSVPHDVPIARFRKLIDVTSRPSSESVVLRLIRMMSVVCR